MSNTSMDYEKAKHPDLKDTEVEYSDATAGSLRGEYMYTDIADFEKTVGYKVNESFVDGFRMARMKWRPVIDKVD